MSKITEKSIQCFRDGCNCAQSILAIFSPQLGLDEITAKRVSAGFGGGMGRMQNTCGAVTGAFMVLGLKYGNFDGKDQKAKDKTYRLINQFTQEFTEKNGSINCREILDCDFTTSEGMQYFKDHQLEEKKCQKCVEDAANLLQDLIKTADQQK